MTRPFRKFATSLYRTLTFILFCLVWPLALVYDKVLAWQERRDLRRFR